MIGKPVPDFSLQDQEGRTRSLSEFKGKPFILYFYPKDDTPGCTAQACSFRDAFEDLSGAGMAVIGVSDDDVASHKAFAERYRLPFTLLCDPGGAYREKWSVKRRLLGLLKGRATYVVDASGTVRAEFQGLDAAGQARDALAAAKSL